MHTPYISLPQHTEGHGTHQHPHPLLCVGHLPSQPPAPVLRLRTSRGQKGEQVSINSDKADGMRGEGGEETPPLHRRSESGR